MFDPTRGWTGAAAVDGFARLFGTAAMTTALTTPFAFAASLGRGYLPAIAAMFVALFCAQLIAALGYGAYFPWSVPALYSDVAGPDTAAPGPWSIAAVAAQRCAAGQAAAAAGCRA